MKAVSPRPSSLVTGNKLGLGIVLTIIGGVCWGFSGTCAQLLFSDYGFDPRLVVCTRSSLAGVIFMVLSLAIDRKRLVACVTNPRSMFKVFVFAVFGVTLCQVCYLFAIQASDAGTATVLQSLNLLIILAVVCVRLKRRPTKKETLGIALAIVGTFLVATHGSFTQLAMTPEALGWGLACAVSCALYTLLPGSLLVEYGSVVVTGLAMVFGGVSSTLVFQPWNIPASLDARGLLLVAAIVIVGTVLSYLCFLNGVKLCGSMLAGLLGCAEPLTACLLSGVWLGTSFAPVDLVGMGMIVLMMLLVT